MLPFFYAYLSCKHSLRDVTSAGHQSILPLNCLHSKLEFYFLWPLWRGSNQSISCDCQSSNRAEIYNHVSIIASSVPWWINQRGFHAEPCPW